MLSPKIRLFLLSICAALLSILSAPRTTFAQITTDGSTQTEVIGNVIAPTGTGTVSNGNLFHSFEQFNVPATGVTFTTGTSTVNGSAINNIINRVTGNDPSHILGTIESRTYFPNANLYLLNPNGVIFGANARLDIGGSFFATTGTGLNFSNGQSFLVDKNSLSFPSGDVNGIRFGVENPAGIINQGNLAVDDGKTISLTGGTVINTGTLTANGGNVSLTSVNGNSLVELRSPDAVLGLSIKANAIPNEWNGSLSTIPNLAEQLTGSVPEADRVIIKPDGSMWLVGKELANQGIAVEQGLTITSGKIDTSNQNGTGGNIGIYGNKVALVNANVNANGTTGGGNILIGGDYLGQGTVPNAQFSFIDSASLVTANAILNGDGGKVIVWADNTTEFAGMISAKGGELAGNGGFVETSGKNILEIGETARVDTSARFGETGTWLLDPLDLTISGTGTNTNVTGASPFQPTGTGSILRDATINTALATNNVVVKTVGTTGTARGDITFANNANVTWATNKTFTVQAAGQILMNPDTKVESTNTGTFNAIIFQANTAGTTTGNFNGIELQNNTQLSTKGGSIQLTGIGGTNAGNTGILISGNNTSITTAGTGTITITGTGKGTSATNYGILQNNSAQVTTANGIITYKGTGASTADGIRIESGNNIIGGNSNKSVVLTSLKNGITLNDVKIETQENIIITSPRNVTQNNNGGLFATTAGKGLQLNGAGNYTLTNPNNDIATLAVNNTGNVSYRDANEFVVGTVGTVNGITTATTKNVTLEAGGAVTQTQKIVTGGLELKGASATYTLTNTANNITTLAANTNNVLKFTDSNALIIGTVGITNGITAINKNVTLAVNAGTLSQTQAITAGGLELTGNGTFALSNVNNDVTILAANVGNPLSFTDKNALTIGTVNTTNGITTSNDLVTLQTGGLLAINKAIAVGTAKVSIDSAGGVIQGTAGEITGNSLRLLGTGTFNLNNTSNNIALLAADVNGSLAYVNTNVMAIDTVLGTTGVKTNNNPINISTVNGNLTLSNVTGNQVNAGTSTVNLTAGGNSIFTNNAKASVIGQGGVTITANSMTLNTGSVINSGSNIATLQPNTAGRLINLGGADVAATTLGLTSAELNTVTAGTLRVGKNDAGNITVSTAIAPSGTNTLSLLTGGTVSQNAGAIINETNLAINSGGAITLNQNNQITNYAANATGNVTLNDLGGLNIGTVDGVSGINAPNFNLTTTGNITQTVALSITGTASFNAVTGDIILTDTNNDFSTIALTGNNATITDKNALNFGTTSISNNLTANTNGNITQSNALSITGLASFNAGTSNITLTDTNNDFSTIALTGNNATITDKNALVLGTTNITNNLSLSAGGSVTQTHPITANGLALLGTGSFNLDNAGNTINTIAANITGDLKFVNSQTLTVGIVNPDGIEKANSVFLQAITGNIVLDQSITALNDITLVADSNFVNNVGAGALTTTTGRFLVYATSPQGNVNGWTVLGGSQQFNTTFPDPALFTGSGFLYRVDAPKISIRPTISLDSLLAQPVENQKDDGELCQGQWINVAENQWQWRSRCFNLEESQELL